MVSSVQRYRIPFAYLCVALALILLVVASPSSIKAQWSAIGAFFVAGWSGVLFAQKRTVVRSLILVAAVAGLTLLLITLSV